jgi:hypothetical protein
VSVEAGHGEAAVPVHVLINDRADVPAIVQRRELAAQAGPTSHTGMAEHHANVERLRRRLDQLQRQPVQQPGLGL